MAGLYLYAILSESPGAEPGRGIEHERLSILEAGGFAVAVGAMEQRPRAAPSLLRRHDQTIRRLMSTVDALLPCRYGEWAEDQPALHRRIATRSDELRGMLSTVEGCEQMTLRVIRPDPASLPPLEPSAGAGGPGTRYLAKRLRRDGSLTSALSPLRSGLGGRLRAEKIQLHPSGRLLASVYHLVPRGEAESYASLVEGIHLADVRLVASGPWPPYAFVRGDFA